MPRKLAASPQQVKGLYSGASIGSAAKRGARPGRFAEA